MRAYVTTTGVIFALIVAAHVLRAIVEGPQLAADPFFLLLTAAAGGMGFWAWRLLRQLPNSSR